MIITNHNVKEQFMIQTVNYIFEHNPQKNHITSSMVYSNFYSKNTFLPDVNLTTRKMNGWLNVLEKRGVIERYYCAEKGLQRCWICKNTYKFMDMLGL